MALLAFKMSSECACVSVAESQRFSLCFNSGYFPQSHLIIPSVHRMSSLFLF